jgi:hypothetical protein
VPGTGALPCIHHIAVSSMPACDPSEELKHQ